MKSGWRLQIVIDPVILLTINVSTTMKLIRFILILLISNGAYALPKGFVYLQQVDPSILQEMRYAGEHNFVGRPIRGYKTASCILSTQAAMALSAVQRELKKHSLTLKVYDCYRPVMAVADFAAWSKDSGQQQMKQEFYPNINKRDVFRLGYVAAQSGHSRGSAVDLTIAPLPTPSSATYIKGQRLIACTAVYNQRFRDNSIDMGTGYDCLDKQAHTYNVKPGSAAYHNRMSLRSIMIKNGFEPYEKEWWHFSLAHEPYPHTYFDFAVQGK